MRDDTRFREAKEKYEMTEEELEDMYQRVKSTLFTGKTISPDGAIAIITGGQPGSGKSGLVIKSNCDLARRNRRPILLDVDDYRGYAKGAVQLAAEYPEYFSDITDISTGCVMRKLLEEATLPNGYDVIFEGTLANQQIINTIRKFGGTDYRIIARLMGTCREESLLSIFERYLEKRKKVGVGRLTSIDAHDKRYDGFTRTAGELEKNGIEVEVYRRGMVPDKPLLLYRTRGKSNKYGSVLEALSAAREDSYRKMLRTAAARLQSINDEILSLGDDDDLSIELNKLNKHFETVLGRNQIPKL